MHAARSVTSEMARYARSGHILENLSTFPIEADRKKKMAQSPFPIFPNRRRVVVKAIPVEPFYVNATAPETPPRL